MLSSSYLHLIFVHSSFILRSFLIVRATDTCLCGSHFSFATLPLGEEVRESGVCVRREVCHLFQLVPLRGFGGLPNKRLATFPLIEGARGRLFPTAYGLRSIASSSFFRLETPFLTFFALLYDIMNQLFIHPFYTNRPRFV